MLIYEGKAKKILSSDSDDQVIIFFKDDTTAFNGVKKEQIANKGRLNLQITTHIFNYLSKNKIENHFIKLLDDDSMLAKKVDIIPLEFICRNRVMGSMKKRLGYKNEVDLETPVLEICYKKDELNDPLINDFHAYALEICNEEELKYMYQQTKQINVLLKEYFLKNDLILADFKIEFGIDKDNKIILADEISPDSCRLIDKNTKKQLDKDLFRLDIGDISKSYKEILDRLDNE